MYSVEHFLKEIAKGFSMPPTPAGIVNSSVRLARNCERDWEPGLPAPSMHQEEMHRPVVPSDGRLVATRHERCSTSQSAMQRILRVRNGNVTVCARDVSVRYMQLLRFMPDDAILRFRSVRQGKTAMNKREFKPQGDCSRDE